MSTVDKLFSILGVIALCSLFFLLGEAEYTSKLGDPKANRFMAILMQVIAVVVAVSCTAFILYLDYDKADKKAKVKVKARPGYFVTDSISHGIVSPVFWSGGRPEDERWMSGIRQTYSKANLEMPVDIYFFDVSSTSKNCYDKVISNVIKKQEVFQKEMIYSLS